ncbi:MAG: glutamate-5-semialdehyde dehydrogenase, partial [Pseudomonadota bacterium]
MPLSVTERAMPFDPRTTELDVLLNQIGANAKDAAQVMATASREAKDEALRFAADQMKKRKPDILRANEADVQAAKIAQKPAAFVDRLELTDARIAAMANGLREIADLDDPVGRVTESWERPNGLRISRVRTPIGVIGVIFESRPNVTADAGALCLKSGNAAILRGGSDSLNSCQAILDCLILGLRHADLPDVAVQVVPTGDRNAVGMMLGGLNEAIDVIVPRGGKSLVERVRAEARVPVFSHLEGICHTYVDAAADLEMAKDIVVNAKLRRPGICGATEAMLVDRRIADSHLAPLIGALIDAGCEVRGDEAAQAADGRVKAAQETDWGCEFLDAVIAVKV